MSKSNVHPGQYKVAGRERQGEDIAHIRHKQRLAENLVRSRFERETRAPQPAPEPAQPRTSRAEPTSHKPARKKAPGATPRKRTTNRSAAKPATKKRVTKARATAKRATARQVTKKTRR